MKLRCAYRVGIVRKKPTNLTISQDIKDRAGRIMAFKGFSSFSTFVEQLIREEHDRRFPPAPPDTLRETNSGSGAAAAGKFVHAAADAAHGEPSAPPPPKKPGKYPILPRSKRK